MFSDKEKVFFRQEGLDQDCLFARLCKSCSRPKYHRSGISLLNALVKIWKLHPQF